MEHTSAPPYCCSTVHCGQDMAAPMHSPAEQIKAMGKDTLQNTAPPSTKGDKVLSLMALSLDLEIIMLCELGQAQKGKNHMISLLSRILKSQSCGIEWWFPESGRAMWRAGGRAGADQRLLS